MRGRWEVVVAVTEARESRHAQPATLPEGSHRLGQNPAGKSGVHVGPRLPCERAYPGIGIAAFLAVRVLFSSSKTAEAQWSPQRLQGVRCGFVVCGGGNVCWGRFVVP